MMDMGDWNAANQLVQRQAAEMRRQGVDRASSLKLARMEMANLLDMTKTEFDQGLGQYFQFAKKEKAKLKNNDSSNGRSHTTPGAAVPGHGELYSDPKNRVPVMNSRARRTGSTMGPILSAHINVNKDRGDVVLRLSRTVLEALGQHRTISVEYDSTIPAVVIQGRTEGWPGAYHITPPKTSGEGGQLSIAKIRADHKVAFQDSGPLLVWRQSGPEGETQVGVHLGSAIVNEDPSFVGNQLELAFKSDGKIKNRKKRGRR